MKEACAVIVQNVGRQISFKPRDVDGPVGAARCPLPGTFRLSGAHRPAV